MAVLPPSSGTDTIVSARSVPLSTNIPRDIDTRQQEIVLACLITPIFSVFFVAARVYARRFITYQFQLDDAIAVGTLFLCVIYSVLLALWTTHGGGMHQDDLTRFGMESEYYEWIMISSPIYLLACMGYKAAILLLYLRLFILQRKTVLATKLTLAITITYLGCNFLTQIFGCRPISKFWDKGGSGDANSISDAGWCIDFVSADIGYGSLNVITDFFIFVLPMPAVWRSGLGSQQKLGVSLVFLSGAVAFAVALVRFQYAIRDLTADDRSYLAGMTMLWMVLEINTGLICSCTPALKPLYRLFFAPDRLARVRPPKPHLGRAINSFRKPKHGPLSMPTFDDDYDEDEDDAAGMDGTASDVADAKTTIKPGPMTGGGRGPSLSIAVPKRIIGRALNSPWFDRSPRRGAGGGSAKVSTPGKRAWQTGRLDDESMLEPLTPRTGKHRRARSIMEEGSGDDRTRSRSSSLMEKGQNHAGGTKHGSDDSWFVTSPVTGDRSETKVKSQLPE